MAACYDSDVIAARVLSLKLKINVIVCFTESIIPSSGVFVVKLAKRGAGLGITISCEFSSLFS